MSENILQDNEESFWTIEKKKELQKDLENSFMKEGYFEKKCKQECLFFQSLFVLGALVTYALNKNEFDLSAQLSFAAMTGGLLLSRLRQAKKQAMIREVLVADGVCGFFAKEVEKAKSDDQVKTIYTQSDKIIDLMFFKEYKPSKRIGIVSSGLLTGSALFGQISCGAALLSGVAILSILNAYDYIHAKCSVKKIARKLPNGVYLPNQNERS